MVKHLVWAQVDLDAIAHNVSALRRITDPSARVMAVVKANGYGHGALEVARIALEHGAGALGVARIDEAIELRTAGLKAPILIFGFTPACRANALIDYDLTQAVYSVDVARSYVAAAASRQKKIRVHLKIDTGMGRLGLLPEYNAPPSPSMARQDNVLKAARAISALPELEVDGVYTHFASADSADKRFAHRQLARFLTCLDRFRRDGIAVGVRHAANSAATMEIPESHLDMVRPGIAIYGIYPSDEVDRARVDLRPAMTLKSIVVHLKRVPEAFSISYGRTYRTTQPATIATVPVGYADGYSRAFSSRGYMLVRGRRAPIVGRVCMDHTMLDVSHIPGVGMEDEVVIFGQQADAHLSAEELAAELDTIGYEIVSALTARVPRVAVT